MRSNDMTDFNQLKDTLVNLDGDKLIQLVNQALESGQAASDILNQGLIAGMDVVGERMEKQDMFIPEVLMAARLMSRCVEILKPLLGDEDSATKGCVVIGTVKGDLHDIGKNLVAMMMESAGLTVHNIGIDIEPAQFVSHIKEKKADLLCVSALLTTTMPMMKRTIEAIVESGLRDQVKILVGGAPVTQEFADEIGADAFAPDAGSAAKTAKALVV
jgi:5-methyltetrahydrofolate--homocysteine methyltransferase